MHDYPIETLARTQRADRLVAAIETVIAGDDLLVITKNYEAAAVVISRTPRTRNCETPTSCRRSDDRGGRVPPIRMVWPHDEVVSEPDYSRLREGLCPVHGTPLDRRDDHGWCDECDCGWSLDSNKVRRHER
jgi:hypothetical protein